MEKKKSILRTVLVGSGNVAWHFSNMLRLNPKVQLLSQYSRNIQKDHYFSTFHNIHLINKIDDLPQDVDWIIFAVSDDAISNVAKQFSEHFDKNILVSHTSGAMPVSVLSKYFEHKSVFYPLQTLTKGKNIEYKQLPLLISATHSEDEKLLAEVAYLSSNIVAVVTDLKRAYLHVAAVFANNYVNFMLTNAEEILRIKDLDIKLLYPLIQETIEKAKTLNPLEAQTGPARRNDKNTRIKHINLLKEKPEIRKIYQYLERAIRDKYNSSKI